MTKQNILCAGRILGRYELLLPVAKGGMAEVWAARLLGPRGASKIVAVKTILRTALDDARLERMFREEAALASRVQHPNVVKTLELGEYEGILFLAMEWVDGEPLNVVLAQASTQGGIPLDIAVNIVGQACLGLHAAHEARDENGLLLGVVHRDVSPQNVLVSDSGSVKLVDFGIAKATARTSALTAAGEIKGKFAYMSPEQVGGRDVDRRSDVFSLGVLLFMLTTGRHPFRGEHPGETVRRLYSNEPAVGPSRFMTGYPSALEAVVLQALAKPVELRWESASEFRAALEFAMPSAFEGNAEVRLSRYMHGLMGAQIAERRRRLRSAEDAVGERQAPSAGLPEDTGQPVEPPAHEVAPRSQGSLRAFYLEPTVPKPAQSALQLQPIQSAPEQSRVESSHNVVSWGSLASHRPSWAQTICAAAGMLFLGIALTLTYQKWVAAPDAAGAWSPNDPSDTTEITAARPDASGGALPVTQRAIRIGTSVPVPRPSASPLVTPSALKPAATVSSTAPAPARSLSRSRPGSNCIGKSCPEG